jgi:hypothetical protein
MKTSQKSSKGTALKEVKNSFESIGNDFWSGAKNAAKDSFKDFNSQLFGANDYSNTQTEQSPDRFNRPFSSEKFEKKQPSRVRRTEVVVNFSERQRQAELHNQIKELIDEVRKEMKLLKTEEKGLLRDVSLLTMQDPSADKVGIYHLRFLQFIIQLLRSIRKKVSEGKMWLEVSFEKKRKKSFLALSKSKGTKFSKSNELSQANIPG